MTRALALLLAGLALPAAAHAVEPEGRGENITHVKNLAYPDLHAPDERNAGTDIEFATFTIGGTAGPEPTQPTAPGATPPPSSLPTGSTDGDTGSPSPAITPTPGGQPQPAFRRPAPCRRLKSAKRGSKRFKRLKQRCRAAKRRRDARPREAGIQRTFAFAGAYGDGLSIVDITDPAASKIVATWDCGISQGDVQLFRRADLDNRTFVTYTADDGYDVHEDSACVQDLRALGFEIDPGQGGTFIAEVTDPYNPKAVSFVGYEQGSHNQTVHPSGRYLYNSNADLITSVLPAIEITDITDVANPETVGEFDLLSLPGLGTESHDITFSPDGTRAYVAALSHGEVLDTTDPTAPERLSTIVDPTLNVWHQMEGVRIDDPVLGERDFIIAEDEVAGALGTGQCPNGGVHVYDATGDLETAPVLVGYWNISDAGLTENTLGTCTAHVFQIDHKEQLMTLAFYNGGVRVVDLSGLVGLALGKDGFGMKELGFFRFPDSDTWSVKATKMSRDGFFLYGNDHFRGFDVYEYAPGGAPARSGRWLSAAQVQRKALNWTGTASSVLALCLREIQ